MQVPGPGAPTGFKKFDAPLPVSCHLHLTVSSGPSLPPYQVASWSIQPFGHNTSTIQTGEWPRSIGWTLICDGRPKPAINHARLALTSKPEVEIWRKRHKWTGSTRLPIWLIQYVGPICHCLADKNYFQFRQTGSSVSERYLTWNATITPSTNVLRCP